jgi:hypothetical protein
LVPLEKAKKKLLEAKEEEWSLKSRALWLKNEDGNTKFFQTYTKGRKMLVVDPDYFPDSNVFVFSRVYTP